MKAGHRVGFFLCVGLLLSALAHATSNVVTNPEFNIDLGGWWSNYNTWWVWSSNDHDGCAGSGAGWGASKAFSFTGDPRKQYFSADATACLPVSPGEMMWIEFDYLTVAPTVRALLTIYSTSDCSGGSGGFYFWNLGPTGGNWVHGEVSGPNYVNAVSVRLGFDAWSTVETEDFSFLVDRVYLGTADRIFSDDFEGNGATPLCRWSASVP